MNGHFARFYEDDVSFSEVLIGYLGNGLEDGESCIVLATKPHREILEERLRGRVRLKAADATYGGRYLALDAAETLASIMVDGWPDEERFRETIGGLIAQARKAGNGQVRLFGEMVNLLFAEGAPEKSIALEKLWNQLATEQKFFLFCSYFTQTPHFEKNRAALADICKLHTAICVPSTSSFSGIQRPRFF
ncbi:MAG: MEDS domain-containing protein [Burkholderiales bacterium]